MDQLQKIPKCSGVIHVDEMTELMIDDELRQVHRQEEEPHIQTETSA